MITYYPLSNKIGIPGERARDKPSLLKNSQVGSGKSLFDNNPPILHEIQNILAQKDCAHLKKQLK